MNVHAKKSRPNSSAPRNTSATQQRQSAPLQIQSQPQPQSQTQPQQSEQARGGPLLLLNANQRRQRIQSKQRSRSPRTKTKSFVKNHQYVHETDIENNLAKLYLTKPEQADHDQTRPQAHNANPYRMLTTSKSAGHLSKYSHSSTSPRSPHVPHSPLSPHTPLSHSSSSSSSSYKQHTQRTLPAQQKRKPHSKSGPPRVRKKRTFKLAEPKDAVSTTTTNTHTQPINNAPNLSTLRARSHDAPYRSAPTIQLAEEDNGDDDEELADNESIGSISHYKQVSSQLMSDRYAMKKGRSKSYTPTPPTPPSTTSTSPSPPPPFSTSKSEKAMNRSKSHQPARTMTSAMYMQTASVSAGGGHIGHHQRYNTHTPGDMNRNSSKKRKRNSFKLGDDAALLPFNKFVPAKSFESYQTKYKVHTPKIKPGSNQFLVSQKMRELQERLRNQQQQQEQEQKQQQKHKKHSHDSLDNDDENAFDEWDELASSMSIVEIKESFGKPLEVLKTIKLPSYPGEIPLILIALKKQLHAVDALKKRRIFHHAVNSSASHHQIAKLLRSFFHSLPTRLLDALSVNYYQRVVSVQQIASIIAKIPEPNQSILLWLWDLLADTVEFRELNRMSIESLSKSMAPKMISAHEYNSAMIKFFGYGIQWRLDLREQK